jgi:hypothetical protein
MLSSALLDLLVSGSSPLILWFTTVAFELLIG